MHKKPITLSQYAEIRKCEYVTLQLIPTKSNKNTSTDAIAALINSLFIKTSRMVKIENKKLIITPHQKAAYYIHVSKKEVQFYFIIPKIHLMKFKTKFSEVWRNIEIREVDCIPADVNKCSKYQLQYMNDDVLSLDVDKRNNHLLNANMSMLDILEDEEYVGIFYNFIPSGERENLFFKKQYKQKIKEYEAGYSLKKCKNVKDIAIMCVKFLIGYVDGFLDYMQKEKREKGELFMMISKEPSESTKRKIKKDICKTQAIVLAHGKNEKREKELGVSMCNTFDSISDDNELVFKKIKSNIDLERPILPNVPVNKTTVEECQNYIALPGKELIEQYKMIQHNKVQETKVPECLQDGEIRIGTVKYRDAYQKAYYSVDDQMSRLARILLGSMGAGKSYYMSNMAKDAIRAGRGVIIIDIIDKCQLSDAVKAFTPKDRLIEIDCSNPKQLQAFSYNELKITDDMDMQTKVAISMQKAEQLQILLDSVNDDNGKLTPRMLRYLYAASTVVFFNNSNASLKDVTDVLMSVEKRAAILDSLSESEKIVLEDEIDDLKDLDKESKSGTENYDSKVSGIIDRVSWLKTNAYTKLAFSKKSDNNIDFVEAIKENKVILVKIPERVFNSVMIRNIIATYYFSKVWLAKQLGATESKTELYFDEIHQSYNCQLMLERILVECRKFNLIPVLAMHYLGQCTNKCKSSILSSGASFLLLSGCDIRAFNELESYFENRGYSKEDLVELERYHALCLIKNEKENYSSFIAKLPA